MRWAILETKSTPHAGIKVRKTTRILQRICVWFGQNRGSDKIEQYEHMKMQHNYYEHKRKRLREEAEK